MSVWLVSCVNDCYPAKEPELKLLFANPAPYPNFKKVYAINGKGEITKKQESYYLPLSMHADSVVYILESQTKTDTLTIFYSRSFYYDSEKCGYVAAIERDSSREETALTTMGNAYVQFTDSYPSRRNIYEVTIYF